ncbi:MAG: AAA family ATPase, partial [Lapillicoccus sp.]
MREAAEGNGRLVLVSGEAGIGKSSLVEALHHQLATVEWQAGSSDGLFVPRPLEPLHDIAAQTGGELQQLAVAGAARETLFAALLRRITEAARLAVYVFEDIHWADEATLDLLRYLGRRIAHTKVLLIATYRDDGIAADDPLRVALGQLVSQRSTRRIDLGTLSQEAVAMLAAGRHVDPAVVFHLSGGNPFYVTEILDHNLNSKSTTGDDVPPSARDAVLSHVAALADDARSTLEVAALMGSRVEPDLLTTASGTSERVLDQLLSTGMLVSDGRQLRFRHEIIRRAVEDAVSPHRAVSAHRRILNALLREDNRFDRDDAVLAFHAEGAGDTGAVLAYAPRAAVRASGLGSHREAAAQYERALRFARRASTTDREHIALVADLTGRLAREQSLVDRWEEAAESGLAELALWRQLSEQDREGDSLVFLSRVMRRLCRGPEATAYAEAAVATAEHLGRSAQLARALAQQAMTVMTVGDYATARPLARRAQVIAVDLGLTDVLSDALNTESIVASQLGEEWEPLMRKALQLAVDGRVDDAAGRAFANLHLRLAGSHRFSEAEEVFRVGYTYCEEHDMATFGTCLRGAHAESLLLTGRWTEALSIATDMLRQPAVSPLNRVMLNSTIGRILARRGDDTALTYLDAAVAYAVASEEPLWIREAVPGRVEAHWLRGDRTAALEDLALAVGAGLAVDGWLDGEVSVWLRRLGGAGPAPFEGTALVHRLALAGDWLSAATEYDRLQLPYEAALALVSSDSPDHQLEGLRRLGDLGASATARVGRRAMRSLGI